MNKKILPVGIAECPPARNNDVKTPNFGTSSDVEIF